MGRLSKEQRRQKRMAKERQRHKRRENSRKERLEPWVAPKMKLFELPPILKEGVPREKRLEMLRAVGKEARAKFDELYPQTAKWLTEYDPIYVLSMCAFYLIAYPEGTDPEATGQLDFYHHYLELLQAFALCQPRNLTPRPLLDEMAALKKHMQEVGQHTSMRHLDIPEHLASDIEINAHRLRIDMMAQTTAIRNWAYPHQLRKVLLDLVGAVGPGFEAVHGVNAERFFDMLLRLPGEREERLNAHIDKIRRCVVARNYKEITSAYNASFPENEPIAGEQVEWAWERAGKKKMNLISMLMTHSDLKLEGIYSFSLDHAHELVGEATDKAALQALIEKVSYRFGDLSTFNREHFILTPRVRIVVASIDQPRGRR